MVLRYLEIEQTLSDELLLVAHYVWSDPARGDDWASAVRRALANGGRPIQTTTTSGQNVASPARLVLR